MAPSNLALVLLAATALVPAPAAQEPEPALGGSEARRLRRGEPMPAVVAPAVPTAVPPGAPAAPLVAGPQDAPAQAGLDGGVDGAVRAPSRFVELAVGADAIWLGGRFPLETGLGHLGLELLYSDDDDLLVTGRLLRFGEPLERLPLRLGVGLQAFAGFVDEPDDEAYGVGLVGSAAYELGTAYPSRFELTVAYAPDPLVFDDGEDLTDLRLSYELDVSSYAAAFVGWRDLEIGLEDASDAELDESLHVGVRLAF